MSSIDQAARHLATARAIHVGTGSSLGVSLPVGVPGSPEAYRDDPSTAWARTRAYLQEVAQQAPHPAYAVLRRWSEGRTVTVFTSRIDGMHLATGCTGDALVEVHGSLHFLQCSVPCRPQLWPDDPEVALPHCPACGAAARPNVLMGGDDHFLEQRYEAQADHYTDVLKQAPAPAAVLLLGPDEAVDSHGRSLARGGPLIRLVQPNGPDHPEGITLPLAALADLTSAVDHLG